MKKIYWFLGSVSFFILLIVLILFLLIYQTLFSLNRYLFSSIWFILLIGLLAINILFCLLRQIRTAKWYFILLHAGIGLILIGGALTMGFRFEAQLPLFQGRPTDIVFTPSAIYRLPFQVELRKFSIEYYRPPYLKLILNSKKNSKEFVVLPRLKIEFENTVFLVKAVFNDYALTADGSYKNRSPFWNNPAVLLKINSEKFVGEHLFTLQRLKLIDLPFELVLRLENSAIKNFRSDLEIDFSGKRFRGQTEVNRPFIFKGYYFYQSSYDPDRPDYSLLTVKKEKFLWLVYSGFLIFLGGMFLWLQKK